MIEIGSKLSGRYTITQTIGQGGMANVYLARDLILDRDVAVKVLRFDFQENKEAIQRFQREAMSASQLLHHNIVEVYDVDEEEGQQYIVMEYVKGTDLKKFIRDNAPISLELVVSIMSQILSAIELAHKNGIIHRDIKPQNILITEDKQVKITDFGIAIALSDTSITQTNTLLGSVHYLSPEQARGANATMKSDIYALGVVLYELITGSVPFDGESAVSIALKHFQEAFPRIKAQLDYVPQSLENVVMKATAKNANDRYSTVGGMLADLSTSLSTSRMFEVPYEPNNSLDETIVVTPLKPSSASAQAIVDAMTPPEPLMEEEYQSFDVLPPISKPRQRKRLWQLLIGGILLAALLFGAYYLYDQTMRFVTMPDITDMTVDKAKEVLAENKLNLGQVKQTWDESVPIGNIISSTPQSGKRIQKQSPIDVIVSTGPEQVELGNYVGQAYEPIRRMLTDSDFIVDRRDWATSNPDEAGIILEQSIPPGTKLIPSENPITMFVGNYSESTTMQDFESPSLSLDMVTRFADGYGLKVNETYEYSDFIPKGQVISQSPAAGTPMAPGDTIDVVISQGPEEEEIVTTTVNVYIEYIPRYDSTDVNQEHALPNKVQVYIGDKKNNINNLAREFEITESQNIQITLYIPTNGTGQYRVIRDGDIVEESNEVYP